MFTGLTSHLRPFVAVCRTGSGVSLAAQVCSKPAPPEGALIRFDGSSSVTAELCDDWGVKSRAHGCCCFALPQGLAMCASIRDAVHACMHACSLLSQTGGVHPVGRYLHGGLIAGRLRGSSPGSLATSRFMFSATV